MLSKKQFILNKFFSFTFFSNFFHNCTWFQVNITSIEAKKKQVQVKVQVFLINTNQLQVQVKVQTFTCTYTWKSSETWSSTHLWYNHQISNKYFRG